MNCPIWPSLSVKCKALVLLILPSIDFCGRLEGSSEKERALIGKTAEPLNKCEVYEFDLQVRGLLVSEVTSPYHIYVACRDNPKVLQKVSCKAKECDGDLWCFVKNKCGNMFNRCKKLEGAGLVCGGARSPQGRRGDNSRAARCRYPALAVALLVAVTAIADAGW
mmetsp:Transcript_3540/g.8365  ORF Transcript_3540/g.8365 Transcript_3540/m.8365 type:complete len:165 (+) Transcript_3540:74-568(+)